MVDQNLEIVEIAFAIVAPGSSELLLDVGMAPLLLTHCCGVLDVVKYVRRSETEQNGKSMIGDEAYLRFGIKQWYDVSAE